MILFIFSVIFVKIKIFSIKTFIQIFISRYKMNQFCVPNRRKAIQRLVLVSSGRLLLKKSNSIGELFFRKHFKFFALLSHFFSHFSYRGFVNEKPYLQKNDAQ